MVRRTIGDDIILRATLKRNGVAEDITGYTVQAAIVASDKITLATGTSVVTCATVDAAAGIVEAIFPRATTGAITAGIYLVEFQASIGAYRVTYDRAEITLESGAIP